MQAERSKYIQADQYEQTEGIIVFENQVATYPVILDCNQSQYRLSAPHLQAYLPTLMLLSLRSLETMLCIPIRIVDPKKKNARTVFWLAGASWSYPPLLHGWVRVHIDKIFG